MVSNEARPVMAFADPSEWEEFLTEHSATSDGVRLQLRRKGADVPGLLQPEALDVALCFGWIDGIRKSLDSGYYFHDFGPRRPRSIWSLVNEEHTERLIAAGRMRPAGFAEIERAKADGRWTAAYRQKDAPVPEDLLVALAAHPEAEALFAALSSQNRFAILFRIGNVKRAETRAAKIAGFVEQLGRGETIYPQRH
jgi:uncharacterized protein YdeI (YjbR/CyaY-like superfamily)